jgi:hypothetical protein
MRNFGPQFFLFLLVLTAAIALSCGGSSHIPQSVTVSPATADGTTGPVQFTATAYYNTTPSPVSPAPATWGACGANGNSSGVSINSNGLAQCTSGAAQTYIIFAFVPDPNFKGVCASPGVPASCDSYCGGATGTAQLTCP